MIISGYISEKHNKAFTTKFKKNCVDTGYNLVAEHGRVHTSADICYTWRMAFRTEFLREHKLFFGEGMKIGEDTVLNVTALEKAQRVMAIDYAGYHYRDDNMQSVMRQIFKPSLEKDLNAQFSVRSSCFSNVDSYMNDLALYYIGGWFGGVINNCKNSPGSITYKDVKRILNTPWVVGSFRRLGFKLPVGNTKEYILMLAAKLRLSLPYYLYIKYKG